jgi:hypothetical protein
VIPATVTFSAKVIDKASGKDITDDVTVILGEHMPDGTIDWVTADGEG